MATSTWSDVRIWVWQRHQYCNGSYTEYFGYDLLDRLNSTVGEWGNVAYAYDAVGNRVSKNVQGGVNTSYGYSCMNELTQATGMGFLWDGSGSLTYMSDGRDTWNYSYGPLDRLHKVYLNDSLTAKYTYDSGGRRVRSWDTGEGTVNYVYSGLNVLDEVKNGSHERHVYAGGMHVAVNSSGVVEYYHVDHLGSTRLKTNSTGGVVYESNYEPYGPGYDESGSEDYRYTGKPQDPTGLYYYGARYYDPVTGRFTTRDTLLGDLTTPQSLNRYAYCRNNPNKYTDPDGRWVNIAIGAGFGAVSSIISYSWTHEDATWKEIAVAAVKGGVKGGIGAMCPGSAIFAKAAFSAAGSLLSTAAGDLATSVLGLEAEERTALDVVSGVLWDAGKTTVISGASSYLLEGLDNVILNNPNIKETVSFIEYAGLKIPALNTQLSNIQYENFHYTLSAAQMLIPTFISKTIGTVEAIIENRDPTSPQGSSYGVYGSKDDWDGNW